MKIGLLVVFVVGLSVTCTTWANDLPSLGYSPGIPVKDLVAKGYRWVTVNGPYACVTEQDVRQITSDHTDLRELHMVENIQAYYLIPGALARVIQDDHANGMSEIRLAGITRPLWTYTKYLSARPIHDTYGTVETPDNAGMVDPSDAAIFGDTDGRTLNERAQRNDRGTRRGVGFSDRSISGATAIFFHISRSNSDETTETQPLASIQGESGFGKP